MNKNSRNNRDIIDLIEFNNDMTRLRNDDQYLVTLKIRNNRNALNTDKPNEPSFNADQITSKIEPQMTTQSKRLNADSKYMRGPKAYIFIHISIMNSPRNTNSA